MSPQLNSGDAKFARMQTLNFFVITVVLCYFIFIFFSSNTPLTKIFFVSFLTESSKRFSFVVFCDFSAGILVYSASSCTYHCPAKEELDLDKPVFAEPNFAHTLNNFLCADKLFNSQKDRETSEEHDKYCFLAFCRE